VVTTVIIVLESDIPGVFLWRFKRSYEVTTYFAVVEPNLASSSATLFPLQFSGHHFLGPWTRSLLGRTLFGSASLAGGGVAFRGSHWWTLSRPRRFSVIVPPAIM